MPKTRFDRQLRRDALKELICGRYTAQGLTLKDFAAKAKIPYEKLRCIMRKTSADWKICDALTLAKALDIPIDEVRACIGKF